jgi:hypothetical protein
VTRTTTIRLIAEQLPNMNSRKRLDLKSNMDPERSLWLLEISFAINHLVLQVLSQVNQIKIS